MNDVLEFKKCQSCQKKSITACVLSWGKISEKVDYFVCQLGKKKKKTLERLRDHAVKNHCINENLDVINIWMTCVG